MKTFYLTKRNFLKNITKVTCFLPVISTIFSKNSFANSNKLLKINLSDIPQIPWDIYEASIHVLATFNLAVHGCLLKQKHSTIFLVEEISTNQNEITLKIKKNILFHNQRPVNAYDVEFSIYKELLINPKSNYIKSLLGSIIGIDQFIHHPVNNIVYNSIQYPSGLLAGIKVVDPYQLSITLQQTDHYFLQNLASPRLPIVPIEELLPDFKTWKTLPIGFGPYAVRSIDLTKYEFFLNKVTESLPGPSFVKFFFHDNDIADIYLLYRYRLKKINKQFVTKTYPHYYANAGFLYNYQSPLGSNVNFRKAISYALDRQKITETVFFHELAPEQYILPPNKINNSPPKNYTFTKSLVSKAKYHLNLVPKELWYNKTLYIPTIIDFKNVATIPYLEEIKTQLKYFGIYVEFLETDLHYDKFSKNDSHALWFTGFALEESNPLRNFLHFHSNSYFEFEHPNDPIYENLLQKALELYPSDPHYIKILNKYFKEQEVMTILFNTFLNLSYNSKTIKSMGTQVNGCSINLSEIVTF